MVMGKKSTESKPRVCMICKQTRESSSKELKRHFLKCARLRRGLKD